MGSDPAITIDRVVSGTQVILRTSILSHHIHFIARKLTLTIKPGSTKTSSFLGYEIQIVGRNDCVGRYRGDRGCTIRLGCQRSRTSGLFAIVFLPGGCDLFAISLGVGLLGSRQDALLFIKA